MALTGLGTEVAIYCPSLDDTGNGTGTLTDLSELHSNGTITGASWVADTDEGGVRALSFDGTNDQVAIASIGFGSDPWSIGLWVKFTDFSDFAPLVVFTSATENYEPGIYGNTQNSGNALGSWWESSDPDNGYDSTGTFASGTWYHVGVSYGADGFLRYYIDGVAKGSTNWGTIATGNSTIYLGHQPSSFFGNLLLDDIRFFDVQLPIGDFVTLATSRGEGLTEAGDATLAVTEDDDTLSATASILVSGTLEVTEADDSLTASDIGFRTATLETTEADDTLSAIGDNFVNFGSLTVTEADDTLLSSASSDRSATLEITEADDTLTSLASSGVNFGTLNVTEADDTLSAGATILVSGSLEATEADDTLNAAGNQLARERGFFLRGMFVDPSRSRSIFLGA